MITCKECKCYKPCGDDHGICVNEEVQISGVVMEYMSCIYAKRRKK